MIDASLEIIIGLIIVTVSFIVACILIHFSDNTKYVLFGFFVFCTIGFIFMFDGAIHANEILEKKTALEKIKIDKMTCQELGNYIIQNSMNYTYSNGDVKNKNYVYAQARYLVCTHTPMVIQH